MLTTAIILLILLQIKHWYVDFVNQTIEEVHSKGIYGTGPGIWHSAKQGIGTSIAIMLVTGPAYIIWALIVGAIDFVIHYHVDWAKININKSKNYTVETKQFWAWLGFDQLMHQLTYLLIVWMVLA